MECTVLIVVLKWSDRQLCWPKGTQTGYSAFAFDHAHNRKKTVMKAQSNLCAVFVMLLATGCSTEPTSTPTEDRTPEENDLVADIADDEGEADEAENEGLDDRPLDETGDTGDVSVSADYERTYPMAADFSSPDGLTWRRSIIHLHSTHSHDACDGTPRPGGEYNLPCLADLRAALCELHIDFAYLTDHPTHMEEVDFVDALLHDSEHDELVMEDDILIGNRMTCEDGFVVTITAGFETAVMPLAFRGHASEDLEERAAIYNGDDPEAVAAFIENGALVWRAHSESRSADWLREHGIQGMEIYNLHANLGPDIREEFLDLEPFAVFEDMVPFLLGDTDASPDLTLLVFLTDNQPSLDHWADVLQDRPMVGTAGTDAHQNVIAEPLQDGERFDGYRRMMAWFSNYVLTVEPTIESFNEGLLAGRVMIAFDTLAHPDGFDAFLTLDDGARHEMGTSMTFQEGMTLTAIVPELAAEREVGTETQLRLLRVEDAVWELVEETAENELTSAVASPGAYRFEVRIVPRHLAPFMDQIAHYADNEFPWIYGNAFRVTD